LETNPINHQKRINQKGYLRKHRNGSPRWKTTETSCSDCVQQSRKEEDEILRDLIWNSASQVDCSIRENIETEIQVYGKFVQLTEEIIYTGDDEKIRENRYEEERSRRNEEVVGSLMAVQDVPKKQARRKRKADNHQATS